MRVDRYTGWMTARADVQGETLRDVGLVKVGALEQGEETAFRHQGGR